MRRPVRKQPSVGRYNPERYIPERYRSSRRGRLLGSFVVVCSLLVIIHSTLSPYQFDLSETGVLTAQERLSQLLEKPEINRAFWIDVCRNVLFFLPLGFGLGYCLLGRSRNLDGAQTTPSFSAVSRQLLAVSFCLSAGVELLQLFEPSRHTSFFDLLCNTTGGVLGGWLLFYRRQWWQALSFPPVRAALTLGLLLFLLYAPHRSTSLQSWNETYRLAVGNEVSGNRPWRGTMSGFSLFDRAASKQEIESFFGGTSIRGAIASYEFGESAAGEDGGVVRSPQSAPALSWKSRKTNNRKAANRKFTEEQDLNVPISPKRWLVTDTAPAGLTSALKQNNAFTLTTQVASAKVKQFGPATIISLSQDTSNRNFTLGQSGTGLVFRLATTWTGQNGTWPEFVVPDVFLSDDLASRNLVITYQNPLLTLYVDNTAQVHQLNLSPRQTWLWTGLSLFRPAQKNNWTVQSDTPALFQLSQILYWLACCLLTVVFIHSLKAISIALGLAR